MQSASDLHDFERSKKSTIDEEGESGFDFSRS